MINVNNCLVKTCPFGALNIGDTFILSLNNDVYIKLKELVVKSDGMNANAFCLNDGLFAYFQETEKVKEVNCTLNIGKWEV